MSHIRVLICRVGEGEQMTEVAAFDLAESGEVRLEATHALDDLESRTHRTGNAILRRLLQAQRELIDIVFSGISRALPLGGVRMGNRRRRYMAAGYEKTVPQPVPGARGRQR